MSKSSWAQADGWRTLDHLLKKKKKLNEEAEKKNKKPRKQDWVLLIMKAISSQMFPQSFFVPMELSHITIHFSGSLIRKAENKT